MDQNNTLQQLVERARQYDSEAFGELYDMFHGKIFAFVYYKLGNRHDAEDISEQVFLKALENIESFEWRGVPFSAWLFRIASNLIVDHYRVGGKYVLDDGAGIEHVGGVCPETAALNEMERQDMVQAIRTLTEDQRQVVVLRFIAGLTNEEVAQAIDKNVGAVKALQYRALIALGKVLGVVYDEA